MGLCAGSIKCNRGVPYYVLSAALNIVAQRTEVLNGA